MVNFCVNVKLGHKPIKDFPLIYLAKRLIFVNT